MMMMVVVGRVPMMIRRIVQRVLVLLANPKMKTLPNRNGLTLRHQNGNVQKPKTLSLVKVKVRNALKYYNDLLRNSRASNEVTSPRCAPPCALEFCTDFFGRCFSSIGLFCSGN